MVIDVGRIKHLGDLMHKSIASNGTAVTSNWRLSADGLKNVVWTPESANSVSYGSNSNEVSYVNAAGASTLVSRADHVHRGVTSLSHASNTDTGPVTLETEGSLYIVRPAANVYRFGATTSSAGGGGGSDLVQVAAGAGSVSIPGFVSDPRIPPGGGSDLEFGAALSTGTTLGSPTTINANSTIKDHLYVSKAAAAGVAWVGRYWAWSPAANDWAYTILSDYGGRSNFNSAGIMLATSTPGAMATFTIRYQGLDSSRLEIDTWTGPTGTGSFVVGTANVLYHPMPLYLLIKYVSSTNIEYWWSQGGRIWRPVHLAHNPGLTTGSIGLVLESENATYGMAAAFDAIRYGNGALPNAGTGV